MGVNRQSNPIPLLASPLKGEERASPKYRSVAPAYLLAAPALWSTCQMRFGDAGMST
jgi:hypothetical protein